MRMFAFLGNLIGQVVDGGDAAKERDNDKDEKPQREVIQVRVEIDTLPINSDTVDGLQGRQGWRALESCPSTGRSAKTLRVQCGPPPGRPGEDTPSTGIPFVKRLISPFRADTGLQW